MKRISDMSYKGLEQVFQRAILVKQFSFGALDDPAENVDALFVVDFEMLIILIMAVSKVNDLSYSPFMFQNISHTDVVQVPYSHIFWTCRKIYPLYVSQQGVVATLDWFIYLEFFNGWQVIGDPLLVITSNELFVEVIK